MLTITATEYKEHLGHYFMLAQSQPIIVTKNDKPLVTITGSQKKTQSKTPIWKMTKAELDELPLSKKNHEISEKYKDQAGKWKPRNIDEEVLMQMLEEKYGTN